MKNAKKVKKISIWAVCLMLLTVVYAQAQVKDSLFGDTGIDPWKTLYNQKGFEVSFIFYSNADNYHDGIVIKIHNKNTYSIDYNFELIFRSDSVDKKTTVEGSLNPGETLTGSNSHLFWVPFKDGKTISEVGIRGCRVTSGRFKVRE